LPNCLIYGNNGGQDGREGHYRGKTEGLKAVVCDSQNYRRSGDTKKRAAELTLLSERQIRHIVKRIKEEGDKGIVHKSRGRESNRSKPQKFKDRITELYKEEYQGFDPTLTAEKLSETDKIQVSKETVRKWLIEELWEKGRIERLFKTLQDRLVKELRLRGISTIDEANRFLDSYYLREFNHKFRLKALNKENLWRQ